LFFPYADSRYFTKVRYIKTYEFSVTVKFHNADGEEVDSQDKTVEVRWAMPEIEIECKQRGLAMYVDCSFIGSDD